MFSRTQNLRRRFPVKPKATVKQLIPHDVIQRIEQLLIINGTIPLHNFQSLYIYEYAQVLDCFEIGYDGSLVDLLHEHRIQAFMQIFVYNDISYCRHRNTLRNKLSDINYQCMPKCDSNNNSNNDNNGNNKSFLHFVKNQRFRHKTKNLFDENNNILWNKETRHLLTISDNQIMLALSPLEQAYRRDPMTTRKVLNRIRATFAVNPEGIALSEIPIKLNIDKGLFNATTYNSLIAENPELFYEEQRDGLESVIFDGRLKTYSDLSGKELNIPEEDIADFVYTAIKRGIYQKTLLLIRKADKAGLKLGVWKQTLWLNFRIDDKADGLLLARYGPLDSLLMMCSYGLLRIESPTQHKNDLRLGFPAKTVNFRCLMDRLHEQMSLRRSVKSSEDDNDTEGSLTESLNGL